MDPREVGVDVARGKGPSAVAQKAVAKCPFDCEGDAVNELGYCRHLVGFVNAGEKQMEPRRLVPCAWRKEEGEDGKEVEVPTEYRESVAGRDKQPLPRGAVLVPIGSCSRVYTRDGIEDYETLGHLKSKTA